MSFNLSVSSFHFLFIFRSFFISFFTFLSPPENNKSSGKRGKSVEMEEMNPLNADAAAAEQEEKRGIEGTKEKLKEGLLRRRID